jgi:hypothetical protein
MKKLLKAYKNLPPEMKMFLALAGMGSPIGAIYVLRKLFPHVSLFMLILYVGAAVAVLALLIFLIAIVFKRGRRKRANRMAAELADDSQAGPQSIDVSAAIKANNEKFFGAVRDMRKNVGISVYDLPWYIVIGDSGCGKTKLVNEGGLTFSTGKPEGYQLGTLNYNWWFTEDAIFVDMAGRLCNPQDDGDRREWSAFLDAIGKGRRGFPINGALVCVSADHLLQDPPEKIEADANTTLERLRDLQSKLGVTFATYLVITKCDKILGFMQFFDRAERDITIKNQIFGWSRPGDFNELYDPEKFKGDFDVLYGRLNELRLRRLNDDAEEIDLGLAYSFPEEFRSLYEPAQIYVRTLFPYIRNPRAVKNLIFRGVYFTSATQEGELILKHLTERLGQQAADQFAPLEDLYPNKRPHFIKDLLFRKVFPEHGLVFRNEQQVVRNKKLHKVLKIGTVVLSVLLITGFLWSYVTFSRIIISPREHSAQLAGRFVSSEGTGKRLPGMTSVVALNEAGRIRDNVDTIKEHRFAAAFLSAGVGTRQPTYQLERIRASLVEKALRKALMEVGEALRSGAGPGEPDTDEALRYMAALEQYIAWFGCRKEPDLPETVTHDGFETLCGVIRRSPRSITGAEGFDEHTQWYFRAIRENRRLGHNPAALLDGVHRNAKQTIDRALKHVYAHYNKHFATLSEKHADKDVQEWMRIRNACNDVHESYGTMLGASAEAGRIATLAQLRVFQRGFLERYGRFEAGVNGLLWRGDNMDALGELRIPSLAGLVWKQRQRWVERIGSLRAAAQDSCNAADPEVAEIVKAIEALGRGGDSQRGLDQELWRSLEDLGLVRGRYDESAFDEEESFKAHIVNVYDAYSEIVEFVPGDEETGDTLRITVNARQVLGHLKTVRANLAGLNTEVPSAPSGESPKRWIQKLKELAGAARRKDEPIAVGELTEYWQPEALRALHETQGSLISRGRTTQLLVTMLGDLEWAAKDKWGYARLFPYEQIAAEVRAPYAIYPPARLTGVGAPRPAKDVDERPAQEEPDEEFDIFGTGQRRREPDAPRSDESPRRRGPGRGSVPRCATHEFLSDRAGEWVELLYRLHRVGRYLDDRTTTNEEALHARCITELGRAVKPYLDTYVSSWSDAYREGKLNELEQLMENNSTWSELVRALDRRTVRHRVEGEIQEALSWILRSTCCATYDANRRTRWQDYYPAREEGEEVADWFGDSLEEHWDPDLGFFVTEARFDVPDQREAPWTRAATDFAGQWLDLAKEIKDVKRIPRRFRDVASGEGSPLPSISWGTLKDLREQYGLEDERLTRELEKFERRAQELLSVELSNALVGIQKAHLPDENPSPGWPYLAGKNLETVEFDAFLKFLKEIRRAKSVFDKLEGGLPTDLEGATQRRAFYRACDSWLSFLQLGDDTSAFPKEIVVKIRGSDPQSDPYPERVEGCAFYARWCVLDLGGVDAVVKTACKVEDRSDGEITWRWTAARGDELHVRLDALTPRVSRRPEPKTLGKNSPLALCAYLQRDGKAGDDRRTWYITETFQLQWTTDDGKVTEPRVGQKLAFDLPRPLPTPIRMLTRVRPLADGPR